MNIMLGLQEQLTVRDNPQHQHQDDPLSGRSGLHFGPESPARATGGHRKPLGFPGQLLTNSVETVVLCRPLNKILWRSWRKALKFFKIWIFHAMMVDWDCGNHKPSQEAKMAALCRKSVVKPKLHVLLLVFRVKWLVVLKLCCWCQ